MKIDDFALERWFARYEFEVEINLCASCAAETTTSELLSLGGEEARRAYLSLGLDYIPNPGQEKLRRQIANLYRKLDASNIQVTTGASEAIFLLMSAILNAGDAIIVQKPIYQSLYSVARAIGVEVKEWTMALPHFEWDVAELERLIDKRTRAIVLNSPHSPTGRVLTAEQLQRVVELVERCNLWLISDEVYRGIWHQPEYITEAAADLTARAVSIGDMTKPFGLGGLRVGWLASSQVEILERCSAMRDYTTMCCAAPSEFLAALALEYKDKLLDQKRTIARRNLTKLKQFVSEHSCHLELVSPQGGLTVFPRLRAEISSESFCEGLVQQYSVLLLPGSTFGVEGYVRMGLGLEPALFDEGLERLGRYLLKL